MNWTGDSVLDKLMEAERSLRAMTRRDHILVSNTGAYWPSMVGDRSTDYAPDQTRLPRQKLFATMTLEQITEVWPRWLMNLSPDDYDLIIWRVHERPMTFKKIGRINRYSKDTARRRFYRVLDVLAFDLNRQ